MSLAKRAEKSKTDGRTDALIPSELYSLGEVRMRIQVARACPGSYKNACELCVCVVYVLHELCELCVYGLCVCFVCVCVVYVWCVCVVSVLCVVCV